MGFFSAVKKFFTGGSSAEEKKQEAPLEEVKAEEATEESAEAASEPADSADEPAEAEPEDVPAQPEAPAEAPAEVEAEPAPAQPALSATAVPVSVAILLACYTTTCLTAWCLLQNRRTMYSVNPKFMLHSTRSLQSQTNYLMNQTK